MQQLARSVRRRGGRTLIEEQAVRQACEASKGQGYEVAYEVYNKAYARSMEAFYQKAKAPGYKWPRV